MFLYMVDELSSLVGEYDLTAAKPETGMLSCYMTHLQLADKMEEEEEEEREREELRLLCNGI